MIEHCIKLPLEATAVRYDGANFDEIRAFVEQHGGQCAQQGADDRIRIRDGYSLNWSIAPGEWVTFCEQILETYEPGEFEELFAIVEPYDASCRQVSLPTGETLVMRSDEPPSPEAAEAIGKVVEATRARLRGSAEGMEPPRGYPWKTVRAEFELTEDDEREHAEDE